MVLGSVAVGDCDLLDGGKLMPRITVQDGRLVLRDGKVGTGQGCCCQEPDCDCTGNPPSECGIDYVALTLAFSFSRCNHGVVTCERVLNAGNGWTAWQETIFDENGCPFATFAQLRCSGGKYTVAVQVISQGDFSTCCGYICGGVSFNTSIPGIFDLPSIADGGACCPRPRATTWEWDGKDWFGNDVFCPDVYFAVPEMSVVLA